MAAFLVLVLALPGTESPQPLVARSIPSRILPVPDTVSPQMQKAIGQIPSDKPAKIPESATEWKGLLAQGAQEIGPLMAQMRAHYGVTSSTAVIAGVPCYIVAPQVIPERNRNRVLVNVHGGGYVGGAGERGLTEAIQMASFTGIKVIAIDYRMPPDHPFPAAMDDAMAVWKTVTKMVRPAKVGDLRGPHR